MFFKVAVLNDLNEEELKYQQKLEAESRPLFRALLDLPQPYQQTCAEFERFIKVRYGKEKIITRRYLDLWAGRYGTIKPLPKWLFSAAIDYLFDHHVNPLSIIPVKKVAEHWARPRVTQLSLVEAKRDFVNQFKPESCFLACVDEAIESIYAKPPPPV